MEYRVLETPAELEQVAQVEMAVWGSQPQDAVPSSLLRALVHGGGLLLSAWDDGCLVGVSLAFPARSGDHTILWSHMTGVLPTYQGRAIGFTLKQKQREWALANGYDRIAWTFDPTRRGNANFNLHRLSTTSNVYLVNFYGEQHDALNAGIPTDRLEAVWHLKDPLVVASAAGLLTTADYPPLSNDNILFSDQRLQLSVLSSGLPYLFVELPQSSSPDTGQWRLALREALQTAFSTGYTAVDFISAEQRSWYVLGHL